MRIGRRRCYRSSGHPWPRGGLDDHGGLFSKATYSDVGFLVASPDPASTKTFVSVGNISHVLVPLYTEILEEDEPTRKRQLIGHVFNGEFEEMHILEVLTDIIRYDNAFTVFSRRKGVDFT